MSPTRRTLSILRETILATAATLCALVSITALIVWPRSHWSADSYWWNDAARIRAIVTSAGSVEIYLRDIPPTAGFRVTPSIGHRGAQPVSEPIDNVRRSNLPTHWTFLGFARAAGNSAAGEPSILVLPAWSIALLAALVPILWLRRHRRRRATDRRRRNLCVRCAYDLRASPDRCPECGTPIRFRSLSDLTKPGRSSSAATDSSGARKIRACDCASSSRVEA